MKNNQSDQKKRAEAQQAQQNDADQPLQMNIEDLKNKDRRLLQDDLSVSSEQQLSDKNGLMDIDEEMTDDSSGTTDADTEIIMGTQADVTEEDLTLLGPRDQDMDGGDDEMVRKAGLDDTDTDGDPLNEAATDMDSTGDDLDIPDADMDDESKEAMGQGDEENNYYSMGGDRNDDTTERTP